MKTILSLIMLCYSTFAFSQSAESVLKSLQNKFDSITDLTAKVSQKSNGKSNLTGTMYFKKENNLRIEFGDQTIVADGETSWNYNKKNKKLIISDYDEAGSGLLSINYLVYQYPSECVLSLSSQGSKQILNLKPKSNKNNLGETSWNYNKKNKKLIISNYDEAGSGLLSINYLVYQYPSECVLSLSSQGSKQVLNLKPKSNKNNLGEVKLYITKENLIDKAVITNVATGTMEVSFSNYKLNQNISDTMFSFTAPEGTTVVDLR